MINLLTALKSGELPSTYIDKGYVPFPIDSNIPPLGWLRLRVLRSTPGFEDGRSYIGHHRFPLELDTVEIQYVDSNVRAKKTPSLKFTGSIALGGRLYHVEGKNYLSNHNWGTVEVSPPLPVLTDELIRDGLIMSGGDDSITNTQESSL